MRWQVSAGDDALAGLPAGPVRQIGLNLLLNAVVAAGHGGRIGLRLVQEPSAVIMGVQDSGPGLAEHLRARLLSDAPVEPGDGVGLRLVRELVAQYEADVVGHRDLDPSKDCPCFDAREWAQAWRVKGFLDD